MWYMANIIFILIYGLYINKFDNIWSFEWSTVQRSDFQMRFDFLTEAINAFVSPFTIPTYKVLIYSIFFMLIQNKYCQT